MGPLQGIRIVEFAGIGPGPFCGMLLADLGAEVVLVDRKGGSLPFNAQPKYDLTRRGKRSIAVDLKQPGAAEVVLRLIEKADGLIEGFRPGVMERLGLGPDVCLARNPRLAYGRLTGWGQTGPLAQAAGHDINYVALSGILFHGGHADIAARGSADGRRRHRRRRDVHGGGDPERHPARARHRAGAGDRHRDHRQLCADEHAGAGDARAGSLGGSQAGQCARRRRPLVRLLRVCRRRLDLGWERSSRSSTSCCS